MNTMHNLEASANTETSEKKKKRVYNQGNWQGR